VKLLQALGSETSYRATCLQTREKLAVEGYDIIGDVHGHADKLEGLLRIMGYVARGCGYRPRQHGK